MKTRSHLASNLARRDEMAKIKFSQMRIFFLKRYYAKENRLKLSI